jgi:uncharacterized protein
MTTATPDLTAITQVVLQPTTGKGFAVQRGQVVRVEQVGNGQCLDFNCYNLHDYKEHLSSLRTYGFHGPRPTTGAFLWSEQPRERQMMTIIDDTVNQNDVLGSQCSALMNEYRYGLAYHSNCQDIFAEAVREWALTPDDTHHPFNGFMHTAISPEGRLVLKHNDARPGDYLDLLAQVDVLAVTTCCGGSYGPVSNFETKGLKITIYEATDEQKARWLLPEGKLFRNQQSVEDFALKAIRTTRELEPDPSYTPNFWWLPSVLTKETIAVPFSDEEMGLIEALKETGEWGEEPGEIVRAGFITWWTKRNARY